MRSSILLFVKNRKEKFTKKYFESEIVKYAGDYKPTQIFAKFIQRWFGVDGIKYRSAKMLGKDISDNNHACYALFVTTWDCLDIDEKTDRNKDQLIMQARLT